MSEIYDSILRGLQEAIDDAKGKRKLQKRTVTVIPVKAYTADEVNDPRRASSAWASFTRLKSPRWQNTYHYPV